MTTEEGVMRVKDGREEEAVAEQVAKGLMNKGITHSQLEQSEEEIAT